MVSHFQLRSAYGDIHLSCFFISQAAARDIALGSGISQRGPPKHGLGPGFGSSTPPHFSGFGIQVKLEVAQYTRVYPDVQH